MWSSTTGFLCIFTWCFLLFFLGKDRVAPTISPPSEKYKRNDGRNGRWDCVQGRFPYLGLINPLWDTLVLKKYL